MCDSSPFSVSHCHSSPFSVFHYRSSPFSMIHSHSSPFSMFHYRSSPFTVIPLHFSVSVSAWACKCCNQATLEDAYASVNLTDIGRTDRAKVGMAGHEEEFPYHPSISERK